jgi:hypothetical protein
MPDFPVSDLPPPPVLTSLNPESMGPAVRALGHALGTATSATVTIDTIFSYPFRMHTRATARQLLVWIGATSNGDLDVGIYDSQGNRIVSAGSTAMSATVNTVQEFNITDTVLAPGDYFLAVAFSGATATAFRVSAVDEFFLAFMPVYEQAVGTIVLPATMTPALSTATTLSVWVIGIQFASVF